MPCWKHEERQTHYAFSSASAVQREISYISQNDCVAAQINLSAGRCPPIFILRSAVKREGGINLRCNAVVLRNVGSFMLDGTCRGKRTCVRLSSCFQQGNSYSLSENTNERFSFSFRLPSCRMVDVPKKAKAFEGKIRREPNPKGAQASTRVIPNAPPTRNEDWPDLCEVKQNMGKQEKRSSNHNSRR